MDLSKCQQSNARLIAGLRNAAAQGTHETEATKVALEESRHAAAEAARREAVFHAAAAEGRAKMAILTDQVHVLEQLLDNRGA